MASPSFTRPLPDLGVVLGGGASAPLKSAHGLKWSQSGDGALQIGIHPPGVAAVTPNKVRIIDGSFAQPLTGQTDLTPTFYLERWEGTDITGLSNANVVGAEFVQIAYPPAKSPGFGAFSSVLAVSYSHAIGNTYPTDCTTHQGLFGIGYVLEDSYNAFCLGGTMFATITAWGGGGTGPARATGCEIDIVNDRADATLPANDYYTIGCNINTGGTKNVTYGILLADAFSAGGLFLEGIHVEGVVVQGSGLVLSHLGSTFAPLIEFRNNAADICFIGQVGNSFNVYGHSAAQVFAVNLASGQLQVNDYTKTFPSTQSVTVGANDSGGAGFKVLRIPN